MVTAEELDARAALIDESPDLSALRARLAERAEPLLSRLPAVPRLKAMLSRDGGVCAADGAPLIFDPWIESAHRCSRCGREHRGDRYDRYRARFQHLWLAERAAHLAALATLGGPAGCAGVANAILAAYAPYPEFPNSDNVLGPSRLFFSTYLESIWLTDYLAAAVMLREAGALDAAAGEVASTVADDAATLIGDFNEGFSNRQTWNNAALAAVAVWFEDADLAERAIESETGLLAHLAHGFAPDGTWHEGENYHLFALQGVLTGIRWARSAGVDALADSALAARLSAALRAPMLSALPDLTFPARKDSRFGVSLAQPMYLDLWERGVGLLEGRDGADLAGIGQWLAGLYAAPAPVAQLFDSYLHEAGEPPAPARSRASLPWTSLIEMAAALPGDASTIEPESVLLPSQGLAVLRTGARYASLECGPWTGGHGHPDRLHLTLHADGVHWLPDYGTGSYVDRDLFWYRSTLAHNAPRLDAVSQEDGDAFCEAFDLMEGWSWARGRWSEVTRTIISGPQYLLDIVQLAGGAPRVLELPWHFAGALEVASPGEWIEGGLEDVFVSRAERFVPAGDGAVVVRARSGDAELEVTFLPVDELVRALGPGAPGAGARALFLLQRAEARNLTFVAALARPGAVHVLRSNGATVEVETAEGVHVHAPVTDGWDVGLGERHIRLAGLRQPAAEFEPLVTRVRPVREQGTARFVSAPPALDGTLDGFDTSRPLALDHEDQYRRSEDPYAGPEELSAAAWANWDADHLYLAVEVVKRAPVFRPADAPPLELDNEPDDINSDGLQLYARAAGAPLWAVVVVPRGDGSLGVRGVADTAADTTHVQGSWEPTDSGYRITVALTPEAWDVAVAAHELGFDLIVNEMRPGRVRRAGQLVWSGGGGWVWLRGDRQDPARFGVLELA